jgi:nucleoid-associated protein YgaU
MKNALLLAGACALALLGACEKKTVEPLPAAKPAMETPSTPAAGSGSYLGAPAAGSALPAGQPALDSGMTTTPGAEATPVDTVKSTKPKTAKATTAPDTSVKTAAATGHKTKYVVKKGDTLSAIAKKHYGKVSAVKKIVAANPGLKPDLIIVGQTIILP